MRGEISRARATLLDARTFCDQESAYRTSFLGDSMLTGELKQINWLKTM